MRIQLSEVLQQDGKVVRQEVPVEMEIFQSRLGKFKIANKTAFTFEIAHPGEGKLEISASGKITVAVPCDRCLEDVLVPFDLNIRRRLNMKQSEAERIKDLDESNFVTGTELDVDQLVYNEVLIEWPLKVLCKDDCKGICSHCGKNLNMGTCDCDHEEHLDPRMAAIKDIFHSGVQ